MNRKILKYGAGVLVLLVTIGAGSYLYALKTLRNEFMQHGEVHGFTLFLDGIVIHRFNINPSIQLSRVYIHGTPWKMLRHKPEYISIKQAEINADKILSGPIKWPFDSQIIDIADLEIEKTILDQKTVFTGSAKQTPETPLLLDFSNDNITGKAEIRIDDHQLQMIDISFDQADFDTPSFNTKRGTGWLSFSFETDWQIIGELDAGIAVLGPYEFFDATAKINGPVTQPEMTLAGQVDQKPVVIDQRLGEYYIRRDDKTLPVNGNSLTGIITTLDKARLLDESVALQKQHQDKKPIPKKPENKPEVKPELPPPVAFKIAPVVLPEINLAALTVGTSLAGFIYHDPLTIVEQICADGTPEKCWTAHGQGGNFSYNPEILPKYFLQLKDYEQVKNLKVALLNFSVQSITVQGKNKTATEMTLKGTTTQNQPAEIQLVVTGGE